MSFDKAEQLIELARRASSRHGLTLDHVVPLARGGKSQPGNVVPACKSCNREKSLDTPVDRLLKEIAGSDSSGDE
jgi:5-methylcytosine-specific restriction protein A